MLSKYLRVFRLDGVFDATTNPLKDISLENQDNEGFLADFDYLYLAQHYPFVNMFWLLEVMNAPLNVLPVISITTPYNPVGPIDEVQAITFSIVPDLGTFILSYDGEDTTPIPFDATDVDIQDALRLLTGLSSVTVSGDFTIGFEISFVGIAAPLPLVLSLNTLTQSLKTKLKFEYWADNNWLDCVDILDASKGLYNSNSTQFSIRNSYSWDKIAELEENTTSCPDELVALYINDCYWLRVSYVQDATYKKPNTLTKIKRICYSFTNTMHVNSVDVEGPSYYAGIGEMTGETDKNNWINECIYASEEMVLDLKRIGFIKAAGQIIELDELYLACAFKALTNIYFQLGKAFETKRAIMSNKYEKALSSKALTFDKDLDARISEREENATETRMTR